MSGHTPWNKIKKDKLSPEAIERASKKTKKMLDSLDREEAIEWYMDFVFFKEDHSIVTGKEFSDFVEDLWDFCADKGFFFGGGYGPLDEEGERKK